MNSYDKHPMDEEPRVDDGRMPRPLWLLLLVVLSCAYGVLASDVSSGRATLLATVGWAASVLSLGMLVSEWVPVRPWDGGSESFTGGSAIVFAVTCLVLVACTAVACMS